MERGWGSEGAGGVRELGAPGEGGGEVLREQVGKVFGDVRGGVLVGEKLRCSESCGH